MGVDTRGQDGSPLGRHGYAEVRELGSEESRGNRRESGLFDYWSGKRKRAPAWMRRMGLEWFGRLIPGRGEPRTALATLPSGEFSVPLASVGHGSRERRRTHEERRREPEKDAHHV
jgi:hypothetical protein